MTDVQPHGPSAPLVSLESDNIRWQHRIEKCVDDGDLLARKAVIGLHSDGLLTSQIQKAFSVGGFGRESARKFVPTRWSITAVDSMLGENLMKRTRIAPTIDKYRIYWRTALDNRWAVLMMPTQWCYELIEAWYPGTTWNPFGQEMDICSSHEFHKGRTTYAEIGGCYYAARLAVNELLTEQDRQAGVIIFREAHPGYTLPVGVWNVRENVRESLKTKPYEFDTLDQAMTWVCEHMDNDLKTWIKASGILQDQLYQKRITDYV
jgi:hypothetical protein